jgi:hypothetical protein
MWSEYRGCGGFKNIPFIPINSGNRILALCVFLLAGVAAFKQNVQKSQPAESKNCQKPRGAFGACSAGKIQGNSAHSGKLLPLLHCKYFLHNSASPFLPKYHPQLPASWKNGQQITKQVYANGEFQTNQQGW